MQEGKGCQLEYIFLEGVAFYPFRFLAQAHKGEQWLRPIGELLLQIWKFIRLKNILCAARRWFRSTSLVVILQSLFRFKRKGLLLMFIIIGHSL